MRATIRSVVVAGIVVASVSFAIDAVSWASGFLSLPSLTFVVVPFKAALLGLIGGVIGGLCGRIPNRWAAAIAGALMLGPPYVVYLARLQAEMDLMVSHGLYASFFGGLAGFIGALAGRRAT